MYPRLAPSNEYFPAASPANSNRPSWRVIIHTASRRFLVFTRGTRVSLSGVPLVELTTTPATLNPAPAPGFVRSGSSCAPKKDEAQNSPQTTAAIAKKQFRITVCMFTGFHSLARDANVRFGSQSLLTVGLATDISEWSRRSHIPDLPATDRKQSRGTRQAAAAAD